MALQPADLVAQGIPGNVFVHFIPLRPVLPLIATAPAWHYEDAHPVGKIEKVVVLQLSFQPHSVEVEVTHVVQLGQLSFRRRAEQHVKAVPCAADEDVLSIDLKDAMSLFVNRRSDLANSKKNVGGIGNLPLYLHFQMQRIELLLANLGGPPKTWIGHVQLRELCGREANDLGFSGKKMNWLLEGDVFDLP